MSGTTSKHIGKYEVIETLGEGRYGDMLLARDLDGRRVAIKCLKLDLIVDDKAFELFQREAGVLKHLSHRAIPRLVDSGLDERGIPYLVQEYVEGENLEQAVEHGMHFTDSQAVDLARHLLDALSYLHGLHPPVVHRDIKPSNIVLSPDGPVIVDFGAVLGKALLKGEAAGTIIGTFGYMAPEMLKGQALPAVDLYSLGATLLYAFSGREPQSFPAKRLKIQFRDSLSLPEPLAVLIDGLLEPAAEDRPRSANHALKILDDTNTGTEAGPPVSSELPVPASDADRGPVQRSGRGLPQHRRGRHTALKVVGAAGGLLLVGLFLGLGPAVFAAYAKTILLGAGIIVLVFLVILTLVGGF